MIQTKPGSANAAPTRARYTVVGFMVTLAMVTYLDRASIGAMAPFIRRDLGLSIDQMGEVFSAFALAYALFEIPTAWWADRRGTRSILTRIVAWWSVFTMATAGAFDYLSMLVVRFLFGMGEAGAWPCVARVFSRWVPARERATIKGFFFAGAYAAGAVTPLVTGFLVERWHLPWRVVFVGFGGVGFAWVAAWWRWFRDDPAEHPSVNAAERELIAAGRAPAGPQPRGGLFWRRLLGQRNVAALCLMYVPNCVAFYFCITWLPTYLRERHHFEKAELGLLASLPLFLSVGTQFLGGWWSDHLTRRFGVVVGRRLPAMLGYALAAAAIVAAALATGPRAAALLIALAAATCMLTTAPAWGTVVDIGREHSAVVGAVMNTAGQVGAIISPLVVAKSVTWFNDWNFPLFLLGGLFVLGAVAWCFIDPRAAVFASEE
ncbi:MAG TPA: MFS transporter [Lacunisphaera sp.]|jgi:MFS family permease|nr:MFS transporter [Lacunisphaera sp.]